MEIILQGKALGRWLGDEIHDGYLFLRNQAANIGRARRRRNPRPADMRDPPAPGRPTLPMPGLTSRLSRLLFLS
jgi:hypothetical protein